MQALSAKVITSLFYSKGDNEPMDSGEDIAEYLLCIVEGEKLGLGGGPYLKYAR